MSAMVCADEKQAVSASSIAIEGMNWKQCLAAVEKDLTAISSLMEASVDDNSSHACVAVQTPRQPVGTDRPRRIVAMTSQKRSAGSCPQRLSHFHHLVGQP